MEYKDIFNSGIFWCYMKCICRHCKIEYSAWYKKELSFPIKCRECKSEDIEFVEDKSKNEKI